MGKIKIKINSNGTLGTAPQQEATLYLRHDVAEGVHDALLQVVEHEPTLAYPAHHAGEVVVQEDDGRRLVWVSKNKKEAQEGRSTKRYTKGYTKGCTKGYTKRYTQRGPQKGTQRVHKA